MRVLVVTTWYPTVASPSTGIFVARDVAAIAGRHDVRVLHLVAPLLVGEDDPAAGVDGGVPVERLVMDPRRPDQVLRAARRIRALSGYADLVHSMAVSALLPTRLARARTDDAPPWMHTEHWSGLMAPETLTSALRAARPAVLRLLRAPDLVAVVGEGLAGGVRQVRPGPVVVIPNIVDVPASGPAPRAAADLPLKERGRLELVGVGGLIERKDPLTAVETTAQLRRRGVDATLIWVGDGPLHEQLRARAGELDVPLRLTGTLDAAGVRDTLAASDVFLLPTRAETFCVAAAEALAAGRPVVVSDIDGPRDFVSPPAGNLVTPGAPATDWADAVEQVWQTSAELSADDIAEPIRQRFSAQAYADRVDTAYRPLVHDESAEPETPLIDLVIAVHSPQRQLARALRSVLHDQGDVDLRVTVVAHNLAASRIADSLPPELASDPRVRWWELRDGIPSPSGPFNHGLDGATAPWAGIMGSDDTLAPGALAGWLAAAAGLDPGQPVVVVPPLVLGGGRVPTPPTRPGRTRSLDLVADRLSYRSAPLGLISRGALALPGARLLAGAQVGGDVPMVTALWAGATVRYARSAPAYLIGEDAEDRVTYQPRPIVDQLRSVAALWDTPGAGGLTGEQRRSVATKLLRIHVFGAVLTRADPDWWTAEERRALAEVTADLLARAPRCADPLSLYDHDLIEAILDVQVPAERLIELAHARRRHGMPRTLIPKNPGAVLHPEAPLRFMAASWAATRSS